MYRSYLDIHRQVFSSVNRHTALILKSKYFNAITYFFVRTKIHFLENITVPFPVLFSTCGVRVFVLFYLAL